MARGRSPTRIRILSSINPLQKRPHRNRNDATTQQDTAVATPSQQDASSAPTRDASPPVPEQEQNQGGAGAGPWEEMTSEPKATKFRFKSPKRRRSRRDSMDDALDEIPRRRHRSRDSRRRDGQGDGKRDAEREGRCAEEQQQEERHRSRGHRRHSDGHGRHQHDHRHRPKRRRREKADEAKGKPERGEKEREEEEEEDPFAPPQLDPDAAFRESLFDAMADDEGAAYWEAVYGQPVHTYASELDRMTEEEYAEHVRRRMWEKTHAGIVEARERAARERRARQEEEEARRRVGEEVERSLRRGRERRRRRRWVERWSGYRDSWGAWEQGRTVSSATDGEDGVDAVAALRSEGVASMWPVESGRRVDAVDETEVREFFAHGAEVEKERRGDGHGEHGGQGTKKGADGLAAILKAERVRWHPDKMQQRLGGRADEAVMRNVTAVFQIVDRLWIEARSKV